MQNNLPFWTNKLIVKKRHYEILAAKLRQCQNDIYMAQSNLVKEYKDQIAFCFMERWKGTPIYKIDPELFNVVIYLSGQEVEDIPETKISLDDSGTRPHLYYKSVEQERWVEIVP